MKRIDTATAEADLHGTGKNGWRDGVGAATLTSTRGNAEWFNHTQEEIANAVELSGSALDDGSYRQLFDAIVKMVREIPVISSMNLRASDSSHDADALRDVCFVAQGGSLELGFFAAVGTAMNGLTPGEAIWTSYDGVNWTKTVGTSLGFLNTIASGNGVIVVGGAADTSGDPIIGHAPITGGSFTLANISALAISGENNPVKSVCYDSSHTRFIAVGERSTPGLVLMYSNSTATAWTLATPGSAYAGEFIKCRELTSGRVIAVGTLGVVQTTDDGGVTWVQRHSDVTLGDLTSITSIGDTVLIATSQMRTMLRSDDNGTTWTEVYSPLAIQDGGIVDANIEHVGKYGQLFFAVCKDDTSERRYIIGSLDGGVTWNIILRVPAIDTTGANVAKILASADASMRLVMVGTVGVGTVSLAFSSSVASVGFI